MDRESNDRTIGYIVDRDESLRERRCLRCEVGRGFPRHVQRTCLAAI